MTAKKVMSCNYLSEMITHHHPEEIIGIISILLVFLMHICVVYFMSVERQSMNVQGAIFEGSHRPHK